MIKVIWFGRCPNCGSFEINDYLWGYVCGECGHVEFYVKETFEIYKKEK